MAHLLPAAPPVQRGDLAADVNPGNLVCGLAASLDGGGWRPGQFSRFLAWASGGRDGEPLLPLRCDHERYRITGGGMESGDVGQCLQFASVEGTGGVPGGLLCLAALHPALAPGILGSMRSRGQWAAMSVRGVEHGDLACGGDLWPVEVSLVSKMGDQADPDALVIGTGRDAVTAWELLTGSPAGVRL
jgi:hypothetical protein